MSDETVRIELEHLKRVHLEPGDVLVLQCPEHVSNAYAKVLTDYLSERFPGHEVAIVSAGAQLGVVRPVPDSGGGTA